MPKNGHISPSQIKCLFVKGKHASGFGAGAITYAKNTALDILGYEKTEVGSKSMDRGNELEPIAKEIYTERTLNKIISPTESIHHPKYDFFCGIPDGLVSTDDVTEFKCPWNRLEHRRNLNKETCQYHDLYSIQCNSYLWITERSRIQFVSYDDRAPDGMDLAVHLFDRDDQLILNIEEKIKRLYLSSKKK